MGDMIAYLDFEFFNVSEEFVTPVCCTVEVWRLGKKVSITDFWVYDNPDEFAKLKGRLETLKEMGATLCSYAFEAECRAMLAMGVDPLPFDAIDLYLEYRQLCNHSEDMMYGKHLIDGKVKFVKPPPRYQEEREEGADYSQMEFNLASATYKMLGVCRDTDHKDLMRERIIRGGPYSPDEQKAIMEYCHEDVTHLRELHMAMWEWWKAYLQEREDNWTEASLIEEQHTRAEYAARTAIMVTAGYPLDVPAAKRLAENVPYLIRELQRDINRVLDGVIPFKVFSWENGAFKRNVKLIQNYLESTYGAMWSQRTDKKAISLSEEALQKMTSARHEYGPTLVDQLLRFARFQQSINGFRPQKEAGKKNFWDSVGKDGRVRPYFGIYGAQSSRSQPAATGFIFLKSAVFRGLVHPAPGKMVVSSDFSQQEFIVAALLSSDKKMVEAYASGDVYLHFAKEAGAIPRDATKETHGEMRDKFKAIILGLSYLMSSTGLAAKLTADTGKKTTKEQAQAFIDQYDSIFHVYAEWREERIQEYRAAVKYGGTTVRLPDGWRMLGDNPNHRSVANMPIQGVGAVVMRKAVGYCQDVGLTVIQTLHDALYCEIESGDWESVDLFCECMDRGFRDTVIQAFGGNLPTHYVPCRQDPQVWGDGLESLEGVVTKGSEKFLITPAGRKVKVQNRYSDKRAAKELKKWEPVLWPEQEDDGLDL